MPQATVEDSPFLGIRLDRGHASFAPGETISGPVVRNEYMRDDDAVVAISLTGRVKTKIVVCRFKAKLCPSATMYRGWTTLIDERQSPWVLFRGPVFVPPGGAGHAWPFAITIPTHYVEAEGAPTRPLPESFTIDTAGFSRWDEGFVEYTLRAEIRTAVATTHAILPITITTTNPGLPVADIPLLPRELSNGVFWPEIGPSGPQGPRAKPKVPPLPLRIFGGHVIMDTPTIIQLEHPDPIPVRLSFRPDPELRAVDDDAPSLKVQLSWLTMEIIPTTEIFGDDFPESRSVTSRPAGVVVRVWPHAALSPHAPPLWIPYREDGPPINVGELAGLRVGRGGSISAAVGQGTIYPSFSTRNLKYTHCITYRFRAEVDGKGMEYSCQMVVTVLPPARECRPAVATAITAAAAATSPAATSSPSTPAAELLSSPPPLVRKRCGRGVDPSLARGPCTAQG